MARKAAIILAGGKGERFQSEPEKWQDKVLAPLFGKPLLVHAIENANKAVDETIICVNDQERKEQYAKVLKNHSLTTKILIDEKIDNLGGPLLGILTGLKFVDAEFCLTLPSDMPLMQPKVIELMFKKAKKSRVVVPTWPNGRLETLTMILEKNSALKIADALCQLGRPRSDELIRGALNVTFISITEEIKEIDPELKSFVNINFHQDLSTLQPRIATGDTVKSKHIIKGTLPVHELQKIKEAAILYRKNEFFEAAKIFASCARILENEKSLFWAAISQENEGKSLLSLSKQNRPKNPELFVKGKQALLTAATTYGQEAKMFEECKCIFLAERAKRDKSWCETRANTQTT